MRYWLSLLLVALGVLIGVQNPDSAHISFAYWSFDFPMSLTILIISMLGLICGWLLYPIQKLVRKKL
jgi:uncharacterized integral membrane protein